MLHKYMTSLLGDMIFVLKYSLFIYSLILMPIKTNIKFNTLNKILSPLHLCSFNFHITPIKFRQLSYPLSRWETESMKRLPYGSSSISTVNKSYEFPAISNYLNWKSFQLFYSTVDQISLCWIWDIVTQ